MQANQTVKVNFEVNTQQLSKAEQDYKNFNDSLQKKADKSTESLKKVESGTNNLGNQFKQIGPVIAGAFAVDRILAFGGAVIKVTSEFQKLEAVLKTTLGSNSEAQSALKQIQNFASQTPFQVQELTASYVKLANQGFKPTIDQMKSLGDLASSTGKSFDQLTEAIIDAQVGEFERLKEFGIRASKQGDIVKFSFKGVETQTKFTSEAIQQYVLGLGKLEGVTGSMDSISKTLGGSISNLSDKWDMFLNTVGSKTDGIFKNVIEIVSNTISLISDAIKSEDQLMQESIADSYTAVEQQQKGILERVVKGATERGENEEKVVKEYILRTSKLLLEENELLQRRINTANEDLKNKSLSNEERKEVEFRRKQFILKEAENNQIIELNRKLTAEVLKQKDARVDITQKEKDAILKFKQNQFQEELKLLSIKEQNAKAQEGDLVKLAELEFEYNTKRVEIYTKYNEILTEADKETKKGLIFNEVLLGSKIIQEKEKILNELKAKEKLFLEEITQLQKEQIEKEAKDTELFWNDYTNNTEKERLQKLTQIEVENAKDKEEKIFAVNKQYDEYILLAKINHLKSKKELTISEQKDLADLEYQLALNKNSKIEKSDKESLDKRKQQNITYLQTLFSTIQGFANLGFEIEKQKTMKEAEELEYRKNQELSNKKLTDSEKEVLEAQYKQKELALKRKQAQQDKNKALFDIGINTAVAITNAFRDVKTAPFTVPLITALGLAQAIAVSQRPLPKFFKGTEFVGLNGNAKGQDTVHAMLNEGERVVPTDINARLKGIKNSDLPYLIELGTMKRKELNGKSTAKTIVNIDNKELVNAFKSRPEVSIDINEKGFRKHLISESKRQQIINSRYAV